MAAEAAMEKPRATVEGAMVNDAFYDNKTHSLVASDAHKT
jgi:hypothetical protein